MVEQLRTRRPDFDLLGHLQQLADAVTALVPDCIGLSIAWIDQGVTFTLVASDQDIAVLDALQYLTDGPCVTAAQRKQSLQTSRVDLLDETRWQAFSQATSHRGVASTLTMMLLDGTEVVGTANLYGASDHAFEGHHEELGEILGAQAVDVVRNADLSFSTRQTAEQAPVTMRTKVLLDAAVDVLADEWNIDPLLARSRLEVAAARAGITPDVLADALLELYGE